MALHHSKGPVEIDATPDHQQIAYRLYGYLNEGIRARYRRVSQELASLPWADAVLVAVRLFDLIGTDDLLRESLTDALHRRADRERKAKGVNP